MAEHAQKPRRWFQIHLSTAVVLMVCAGGLLGLNLTGTRRTLIEFMPSLISDDIRMSQLHFNRRDVIQYGWPARSRSEMIVVHSSREQCEREGTIIIYDSSEILSMDQVRTRWPNVFAQLAKFENEGKYTSPSDVDHGPEHGIIRWDPWEPEPKYSGHWESNAMLINSATVCAILAIVALACEWRIRRREARKP